MDKLKIDKTASIYTQHLRHPLSKKSF